MTGAPLAQLDHLVVAGATLAQAIEYVADLTGIVARPGGQHLAMGTHNALVRLGRRAYLELIAVDPTLPKPGRPRWFDIDLPAMQLLLEERPQLVGWVARTTDIERAITLAPVTIGPVHTMSRGDFHWRMTIPDDGSRPGRGVLPTLIQWDVDRHPAEGLVDNGASVVEFAASHPAPEAIRPVLAALGLQDVLRVTYDAAARLAAMLRTPRGLVTL